MQKKGFTLIEVVVGMVVIGVGLISTIAILQYATRLTNTTKSQIIAINLAREGMERIFNIRDTNRKMYSSKKDQCWLVNATEPGSTDCEHIKWLIPNGGSGGYTYLVPSSNLSGMYMLSIDTVLPALQVKEHQGSEVMPAEALYRMCLDNNRWDYCANFPLNNGVFATQYGQFWRAINIKGLYDKSGTNPGGDKIPGCSDGSNGTCGNNNAKELRFCSKVDYIFDAVRSIEMCTSMTNFLE